MCGHFTLHLEFRIIPGGQNLSKDRQTVFLTAVDPMNKEHKDPLELEETSKHGVFGLTPSLIKRKDLISMKHDRTEDTLPAYCIPKATTMGSGEVIYEKVYASPQLPPNISFTDNWMKEMGSQVAGGGKDSQRTQPKTKNPIVRTGRLVLSEQRSASSVQEIESVSNVTAKAPMKEQGDLFFQLCASVC